MIQTYLFPAQLFAPLPVMLAGSKVTLYHRSRPRITAEKKGGCTRLRPGCTAATPQSPAPVETFERAIPVSHSSVGINNGNCVLLYVACLEPQRDHANLSRALAQIPDADLVLAGDGSLRAQLEAQAENLGVRSRVHFLGRRMDVAELLKMADIYVHPAAFEGFGIAAAEALTAGKPVVAGDVPGLAQVVGDATILVPPPVIWRL